MKIYIIIQLTEQVEEDVDFVAPKLQKLPKKRVLLFFSFFFFVCGGGGVIFAVWNIQGSVSLFIHKRKLLLFCTAREHDIDEGRPGPANITPHHFEARL